MQQQLDSIWCWQPLLAAKYIHVYDDIHKQSGTSETGLLLSILRTTADIETERVLTQKLSSHVPACTVS